MMRQSILAGLIAMLVAVGPVQAQGMGQPKDWGDDDPYQQPPPVNWHDFRYTDDARDRVFISGPTSGAVPLIVGVDGSGWDAPVHDYDTRWVPYWAVHQSFVFARAGRRPIDELTVDQALRITAQAIARLRTDAARYHIDPNRIFLFGQGSGAMLATLLATDPHYLRDAGVPLEAIVGVAAINPDGLDLPALVVKGSPYRIKLIQRYAGKGHADLAAISPVSHTAAPNAAHFLFEVAAGEKDLLDNIVPTAVALNKAGTDVHVVVVPPSQHGVVESYLGGKTDNPATKALLSFLRGASSETVKQ
jgi:arylformamidase